MVKISVRVKPNSKSSSVEKISDYEYAVRVKAPAAEGKANEALLKAMSEHLGVPKSRISIARGHGSRTKLLEIP